MAVEIAARLLLPVPVGAALDAEPHEHVQERDEHSDPDERDAGPHDGVVPTERRKKDPSGDDPRGKYEPNRQHRPGGGCPRSPSWPAAPVPACGCTGRCLGSDHASNPSTPAGEPETGSDTASLVVQRALMSLV